MTPKLVLADGTTREGKSFGYERSSAGEVVFLTGMTGYPQAYTDTSFAGQILVMTYPIIGSYGVPHKLLWEAERMRIAGLIVSQYIDTPSHYQSKMTLSQWLKKSKIPALEIKDTRFLAQHLRDKGSMLGKLIIDKDIPEYDPNKSNIVAEVSTKKIIISNPPHPTNPSKTVLVLDCGGKTNITNCFLKRGVRVITAPWDYDPFNEEIPPTPFTEGGAKLNTPFNEGVAHSKAPFTKGGGPQAGGFDALFISNGPGDPKNADKTIQTIKKALDNKIPTLGICLGNQLLALAAGGDTYKLKFGHRSQNQPCIMAGTNRCYITTQNHGFAIGKIPPGFKTWFTNANDQSIEGIKHEKLPFMSVQFHPEAAPGPMDTEWIFDYFLERIPSLRR